MALASQKHIALIGNVNCGKSSLFNALIGQDIALVSNVRGTTTDPVFKSTELIPYGPVVFVDTAGFGDNSTLGNKRSQKTIEILKRCTMAMLVLDAPDLIISNEPYNNNVTELPTLTVINKCNLPDKDALELLKTKFPSAFFLSSLNSSDIDSLRSALVKFLHSLDSNEEPSLLSKLLPHNSKVILVIPIDSEAPKGRLILPQSQIIRDCLDNNAITVIVRETELAAVIKDTEKINLVITDSQIFGLVDSIIPKDIPLTSFSILTAYQKGGFAQLAEGIKKISALKNGDKIIMLEGCTHNHNHEDIGRVKIPSLIRQKTGLNLEFEFFSGNDLPEDLTKYAFAIQCGGCMLTKELIKNRLNTFEKEKLAITNYGLVLAWGNRTLERTLAALKNEIK